MRSEILISFLMSYLLLACSINRTQKKSYTYPAANNFPNIMTEIKTDHSPVLLVELKASSLKLDCSLRNDSPYYWCSLEGILVKPDPALPQKIYSIYQTVVAKNGVENSKKLVSRLKKNASSVFLILVHGASVFDGDSEISGSLLVVYNERECMDLFYEFSLCPKSSRHLDINSGDYLVR